MNKLLQDYHKCLIMDYCYKHSTQYGTPIDIVVRGKDKCDVVFDDFVATYTYKHEGGMVTILEVIIRG
jgi:hypothetical protein